MKNSGSKIKRNLISVTVFIALSAVAEPAGTLPAELEPYFNAIRMVESRNHPWSIFDNTTRQSYRLNSRAEAEAKAAELIKYGHNVDLGLMQLNCRYQCKRPGVSLDNIFDPMVNVNTARIIFMEFWEQARRISTDFNARIVAAVGAYNNGRVGTPNVTYVQKVWQQLGKPVGDLPDTGSGKVENTPASKSMMEEVVGRAGKGADWARERWDALTKRKDTGQTEAKKPTQDNNRETVTVLGSLGMIFGSVAIGVIAYFIGPILSPILKLMGGKRAAARMAGSYMNNRRKQTQEEMNA